LKRRLIPFLPLLLGGALFLIGRDESGRDVGVVAIQFMLLILFAVLTISWVRRLVKHPFVPFALRVVGITTTLLGLYTYWKLRDPMLAFPFFLMAAWALYRAG